MNHPSQSLSCNEMTTYFKNRNKPYVGKNRKGFNKVFSLFTKQTKPVNVYEGGNLYYVIVRTLKEKTSIKKKSNILPSGSTAKFVVWAKDNEAAELQAEKVCVILGLKYVTHIRSDRFAKYQRKTGKVIPDA